MGVTDQGVSSERWAAIPRTLIFLTNGGDVLLMERGKHKRVFPGRYNGIGGHVERHEDPISSARREITEETGLPAESIRNLRLRGLYHIDAGGPTGVIVYIFTGESTQRAVTSNGEGTLHWVPIGGWDGLPLTDDLPILLPRLLGPSPATELLSIHVHYDAADTMILRFGEP